MKFLSIYTNTAFFKNIYNLKSRKERFKSNTEVSCVLHYCMTNVPGALYPEVKRRKADHLLPFRAEVKNEWGLTSIPLYLFMTCKETPVPFALHFAQ
jgi:hypothetical protein